MAWVGNCPRLNRDMRIGPAQAVSEHVVVVRQHLFMDLLDPVGCFFDVDVSALLGLQAVGVAQVGVKRAAVSPADLVAGAGLPAQRLGQEGDADGVAPGFHHAMGVFQQIVAVDHRRRAA